MDYNRSLSFTTSIRSLGLLQPAVLVANTNGQINGATQNFEISNPKIADSVKDTSNANIAGSYICISTPFNNTANFYAELASSGIPEYDSIPITLYGNIGSTEVFRNSNVRMNNSSTLNISQKYSKSPFGYAGDVIWSVIIEHTGQVVGLSASTRIEVYYVNGGAAEAPFFLNAAVDVRLLRVLVLPASSGYCDSMTTALMKTGYKYDVFSGGSGWGECSWREFPAAEVAQQLDDTDTGLQLLRPGCAYSDWRIVLLWRNEQPGPRNSHMVLSSTLWFHQ